MQSGSERRAAAVIRTAWTWGRVIGGAGILVLLGWRLGSSPFLHGMRVVDGETFSVAVGLGAVTTVLSAWRWSLVARGLGMQVPLRDAVSDYYRSLFINAVLPGGVLGDVHRAVQHGRDVGDVARAVKAVVLERSAGQIVLVSAGVTVLVMDPQPLLALLHAGSAATTMPVAIGVAAAVAVVTGVLVRGRTSRWAGTARAWGTDVRRGLLSSGNRLGIFVASAGVLAGHLATFALAAHAVGSTASFLRLVPLLLLALLAMTLPLNIGGWGPREGALAWAFGAAGLNASQGLTIAVVYGLFAFVASLPGAAVMAAGWIARLRLDRGPQHATLGPVAGPVVSWPVHLVTDSTS
jgi:uncharacterized membrane protein YbhN (UPF0104 family)